MIEKPSTGRAEIYKNGHSIEIHIPTKKSWPAVIFLMAWLGGWLMGEVTAISQIFDEDSPGFAKAFLFVWITMWTVGGGFALVVLLWLVAGREVIVVDSGILEIGRQVFNLKRSKKYDIKLIRHLAINPTAGVEVRDNRQRVPLGKGGVLKFDYGLKTVKFGGNIEEAEGRLLIEAFKVNPNFRETNFG